MGEEAMHSSQLAERLAHGLHTDPGKGGARTNPPRQRGTRGSALADASVWYYPQDAGKGGLRTNRTRERGSRGRALADASSWCGSGATREFGARVWLVPAFLAVLCATAVAEDSQSQTLDLRVLSEK